MQLKRENRRAVKVQFASGSPALAADVGMARATDTCRAHSRSIQSGKQFLRLNQVGGVEALGEPAESLGELGARLRRPALSVQQSRQRGGSAQLQRVALLGLCDGDSLLVATLRVVCGVAPRRQ